MGWVRGDEQWWFPVLGLGCAIGFKRKNASKPLSDERPWPVPFIDVRRGRQARWCFRNRRRGSGRAIAILPKVSPIAQTVKTLSEDNR